jgi:prolyl oligopeptidase
MKNSFFLILIIAIAMGCNQQASIDYPETTKGDVVDNYHGTEVPDPYRWLEDDMSDETAAWVRAQNKVTFSYLESIPFRDAIKDRMTEIWNYPKMSTPFKEGEFYFYSYNTGLQNQDIIYKKKSLDEEGEVFLDPNTFSEDGTVALAGLSFSRDHQYAAYGISKGGSDWREFFVKNIHSGEVMEDHIKWIKNSGASWYKSGFFYTRYDTPAEGDELKGENKNAKIYYHEIGTAQAADRMVHKDEAHPDRSFYMWATEDEKYIMLAAYESTSGNSLAFKKAGLDDKTFAWLDKDFDDDYTPIGNHENMLFVLTNNEAPLYRLVGIDLNNPSRENWVDIIPEHGKNVLESATLAGGKIIATYLKDAYNEAVVYNLEGSLMHKVSLPGIGSLGGFNGKMKDNTAFYSFTSFNYPTTTFKYNIEENDTELFYAPEVDFDAQAYESKQVFYKSKDGTEVPMFIVHKKGLELDGSNPTLLYGYGGFNISETPNFSISRAVWLEQGGVFALANIRGGGEYGEKWHKAGTILQKQNVFDDFIAAAEYLIHENYTSSKRLAIYGGSNGGLLIGAVVNQRPELFAAAIPMVGVMDMLRFHKFTIGRYWTVDYGSSDDPEQFNYLLGYSPIHNITSDIKYPAILVTTGDHDDRVVPAHSFKYAATLQEKYSGKNPVLIRINTDAGHGAGKPTDMIIREYSDVWAFIYRNMDFTPKF